MTTSPALEKLSTMALRASHTSGRTFSPEEQHSGLLPRLGRLLCDAGYQQISLKAHVLDFSKGAEAHNSWYQNYVIALKLLQPFLVKIGVGTQEEVEVLYQQVLEEMQAEEFCALWLYLSVYGEKP